MKKSQKIYLIFKRFIDICGSFIGIFFCLAFFWWWVLAINIFVTKGHPFFAQERYGKNKKIFKIYKFRSMKISANPNLAPSQMTNNEEQQMRTKFGRFLRRSSLDETLQLFNILVGHMSFIGPRPGAAHNEEDLVKYREETNPSAFEVRPGLGGLAQTNMKRTHDPKSKALYDSLYVKNISLYFDFKIFVLTILRLFNIRKEK